jgi:hypothetical protein
MFFEIFNSQILSNFYTRFKWVAKKKELQKVSKIEYYFMKLGFSSGDL